MDTRIRRLREGRFDAILLAMAGLTRLGRAAEVTEPLDPDVMLPAPGQGAIALECRDGDAGVRAAVRPLHHEPTARAVDAERAFLAALGGGCNVPLGAHAESEGGGLWLRAFVAREDGTAWSAAKRAASGRRGLGRGARRGPARRGPGSCWARERATRAGEAPLAGRRILVTRRPEQSRASSSGSWRWAPWSVELPTIEIAPPGDTAPLDACARRAAPLRLARLHERQRRRAVAERHRAPWA